MRREHGRKDQRDHGHHGFGRHMGSKGFEPLAKHNAKKTTGEMLDVGWIFNDQDGVAHA